MDRIQLIREAHARWVERHPVRFAVVGPKHLVTRHRGIEVALQTNNARQARVVVRLEDGVEMTVARAERMTERAVDKMVRRLHRAPSAPWLPGVDELPDADAAGEEEGAA